MRLASLFFSDNHTQSYWRQKKLTPELQLRNLPEYFAPDIARRISRGNPIRLRQTKISAGAH